MTITRTNFPQYQVMTGSSGVLLALTQKRCTPRPPKRGPLCGLKSQRFPWSDFAKLGALRSLLLGRTLRWLIPYSVSWRLRWLYVRLGNYFAPMCLQRLQGSFEDVAYSEFAY